MNDREYSLRSLVDKWIGRGDCTRMQVTHFSHGWTKPCRFVQIMATHPSGSFELVFFRHADGSWEIFPPNDRRPTMGFSRVTA